MSRQNQFPKYDLLGVEIDALTQDRALEQIKQLAGKRGASYVVKPYVEFLDQASNNPTLASLLNDAALCLPDGVALLWGAHYLYGGPHSLGRLIATLAHIFLEPKRVRNPLPERFGGVSFTWPLLEMCQTAGLKVYLIGSPRGQRIQDTSLFLLQNLPELKIVGQFSGNIDKAKMPPLMRQLDTLRPDVILVGMGFPRQEVLISQLVKKLKSGVLIGEGGSFDYQQLGGKVKRAPAAWQHLGIEWLWRLILQPNRIIRQLAIPRFIFKIYRQGRAL